MDPREQSAMDYVEAAKSALQAAMERLESALARMKEDPDDAHG